MPDINPPPPAEGQYASDDWMTEHSDIIRCPHCFGPVKFKDWVDKDRVIATHYRCEPCRTEWWSE